MNPLEQFHEELDDSSWDVLQEDVINKRLQEINQTFSEAGNNENFRKAETERQAFLFSKSPEKRLSYKIAGTQTMEDGTEVPFEWPRISDFLPADFDHLCKRFTSTQNTYAKTEYGLVLYYAGYKKDNAFIGELLQALFSLLQTYVGKAKLNDDKEHYILYAHGVWANLFHIANRRKEVAEIGALYKTVIQYTFDVHQNWEVLHEASMRTVIDLTDFAIQYFKDFSEVVSVEKFLEKNWVVARSLTETYVWGAIYVADISIRLCRKLKSDARDWLYFKAAQYEKLSEERKDDMAAVSFLEEAMSIYRTLKDADNLDRLQQRYQKLRTEYRLGEVVQEMPQDEAVRLTELIKSEVKAKSEEEILRVFILTPMLSSLADIKKRSEESFKESFLSNILPTSIQDKFGNTVAQYFTNEERSRFSLLSAYDFHLQYATQTLVHLFMEAFRANKASATGIMDLLGQTWLGEEGVRKVNGHPVRFSYVKAIEPGLLSFFEELNKWRKDESHIPNLVAATDSLILKAEYLLREVCRFLGIATFRPNPKQPGIIMEKTLDDLLNSLEGKLTEDDLFFIRFALTEKAGHNLRNRIAHGLMDAVEYSLEYILLAIIIILKLGNYQFIPKEKAI